MKKSAFTLIELLVVIAIIAILAGIALPVFSTVMEKGRAAQDANNLHQIGIGITAYLADNNDQIFSSSANLSWPSTLYGKYVTNWNVFKSPFDSRTNAANPVAAGAGVPVSYGIKNPSQLIFLAPNIDPTQTTVVSFPSSSTGDTNVQVVPPTSQSSSLGTHSHRSQINALFSDSHVSSVPYITFSSSSVTVSGPEWQPLYVSQ
jgi:prepilin-type N-terminal cleavage/methylation domain-containing protein